MIRLIQGKDRRAMAKQEKSNKEKESSRYSQLGKFLERVILFVVGADNKVGGAVSATCKKGKGVW